jgi:hypothetical protein
VGEVKKEAVVLAAPTKHPLFLITHEKGRSSLTATPDHLYQTAINLVIRERMNLHRVQHRAGVDR